MLHLLLLTVYRTWWFAIWSLFLALQSCDKKQSLKWHNYSQKPQINTNPKENVFRGVEASCINTCCVGGISLTHHPAGEARDGAGGNRVIALFWSSWCICHHKVYGALRGTTNLETWTNKDTHFQAFIKCFWLLFTAHSGIYTLLVYWSFDDVWLFKFCSHCYWKYHLYLVGTKQRFTS